VQRNRSIRRSLMSLAVASCLLAIPTTADAAVKTKPMSFDVSASRPVAVRVIVAQPKTSYTQACFNFAFVDNGLDPNEEINVNLADGRGAGALNPTDSTQWSRTICSTDPLLVQQFNDGRETLTVSMPLGSANVSSFTVSLS
jgi:hypothetical protein